MGMLTDSLARRQERIHVAGSDSDSGHGYDRAYSSQGRKGTSKKKARKGGSGKGGARNDASTAADPLAVVRNMGGVSGVGLAGGDMGAGNGQVCGLQAALLLWLFQPSLWLLMLQFFFFRSPLLVADFCPAVLPPPPPNVARRWPLSSTPSSAKSC